MANMGGPSRNNSRDGRGRNGGGGDSSGAARGRDPEREPERPEVVIVSGAGDRWLKARSDNRSARHYSTQTPEPAAMALLGRLTDMYAGFVEEGTVSRSLPGLAVTRNFQNGALTISVSSVRPGAEVPDLTGVPAIAVEGLGTRNQKFHLGVFRDGTLEIKDISGPCHLFLSTAFAIAEVRPKDGVELPPVSDDRFVVRVERALENPPRYQVGMEALIDFNESTAKGGDLDALPGTEAYVEGGSMAAMMFVGTDLRPLILKDSAGRAVFPHCTITLADDGIVLTGSSPAYSGLPERCMLVWVLGPDGLIR